MNDAAQIAVLLLELYVAFGIMLIGFGYMLAGKTGGGWVAQFYFAGSWRWTLRRLRALVVGLLAGLWALVRLALAGIRRLIMWLARPPRPRPQARQRQPLPQRRPAWEVVRGWLAKIDHWRQHTVRWHSMTLLLLLLCVVLSVFLICLALLVRS